jgi:hypothetical protein
MVALLFLLAAATPVPAHEWPTKTVRIVVPFSPGSTPDIVVRLVADGLQQKYPTSTFVVKDKPGASGNLDTCRKGHARWLDSRGEHRRAARHQHAAFREVAVRSPQGHRADYSADHPAEYSRRQSEP